MTNISEPLEKQLADIIWQGIPVNNFCNYCEHEMPVESVIPEYGESKGHDAAEWDIMLVKVIDTVKEYIQLNQAGGQQ